MPDMIRTHFSLPRDLVESMDDLVGKGKRNSLVQEILDKEVRRRRLLQILAGDTPIWKDEDHPELKDGAYAYVRKMRDEDAKRERERLNDWLEPPA